jgi:NADH-quinone oxidoreductase subunit A
LGDVLILFLIQNIIIFAFIFWFLTFAGEFFFKKKNHITKKNFYECGFKTNSDINIQINFNFCLIAAFLILYDIEFILLVPVFFNIMYINLFQLIIVILFISLILISLIYDWKLNALNWYF